MKKKKYPWLISIAFPLMALLAACGGPTVDQAAPQQTVVISPSFQTHLSPIPTVPPYLCGAWTSNNAPGPNSTITIYARLTQSVAGVSGATATAVVHFQGGDQTLDQHPTSDNGGYVSFTLALQGQQPVDIPATISITFSNFPGGMLNCSRAFFTPH